MKKNINRYNIIIHIFVCINLFSPIYRLLADEGPLSPIEGGHGTWHGERFRNEDRFMIMKESEIGIIQDRIQNGASIFATMYSNSLLNRNRGFVGGIYEKAVLPNSNFQTRNARALAVKNKAFVYMTGLGVDSQSGAIYELSTEQREVFKNEALELLNSFDESAWSGSRPDNAFEEWLFLLNHNGDQYQLQYRAKELICYLEAYDMLRPIQSARVWQDAIARKLMRFTSNIYFLADIFSGNYSRNNHRIITSAALGMAAVLLGDWGSSGANFNDRDSRSYMPYAWIGYAMTNINSVLYQGSTHQVYSDGGYNEGPHYLRYSLAYALPFFKSMKNFGEVFNISDTGQPPGDWTEGYTTSAGDIYNLRSPWFGRVSNSKPDLYDVLAWIAKIRQPEGRIPGIADTYNDSYFPELSIFGGPYFWPIKSFDPQFSDESILHWSLNNFMDNRVDFIAAGNTYTSSPIDWPEYQVFEQTGDIVFRSGWGLEDIYLHLYARNYAYSSSDYDRNSHIQNDNSSFLLGYKGQVLALDAGYVSFTSKNLVENPQNHNLILINGNGPSKTSTTAQIVKQETGFFYDFAKIQTHYASTSVTRNVLFFDKTYFTINDQLNGSGSNSYKFLLHGNDNSPEVLPDGAIWQIGDAKLRGVVTSDLSGNIINYNFAEYIHGDGYNKTLPHQTLEASKQAVDTQFLSLLFPFPDDWTESPEIETISDENYAGLFIGQSDNKERFELIFTQVAPGNAIEIPAAIYGQNNRAIESIQTNAYFLLLSFDPNTPDDPNSIRIFNQDMTYLNYGSYVLFPNLQPIISTISDHIIDEGSTLEIDISASDANGDILTFSVNNMPSFGTIVDHGNGTATLQFAPDYADAGTYPNIEVTVADDELPALFDQTTFTLTIQNINRPPVAIASADTTSGTPPLTINFRGSDSYDPDGNPLIYNWDFGDGETSTENNPQHTYNSAGKFKPTLTVTDNIDTSRTQNIIILNDANLDKIFITEVSDAENQRSEYLEIYNYASYAVDLSSCKLIPIGSISKEGDPTQYVFDFGNDESVEGTSTIVNPFSVLIIARGATKQEFETDWSIILDSLEFNSGNVSLRFGDLQPNLWILRYFDGEEDSNDGSIIDNTLIPVGGDGNRSYQISRGVWSTTLSSQATPGELEEDQSLPVGLVSFTAQAENGKIQLKWITKSEFNNLGFYIYKSTNQHIEFEAIASYKTNDQLIGLGTSPHGKTYTFFDKDINIHNKYWYKLINENADGTQEEHGPIFAIPVLGDDQLKAIGFDQLPDKYKLYANHPNPFNGTTKIQFDIPAGEKKISYVNIYIYDMLGRKIDHLLNDFLPAGRYQVTWDGTNISGQVVPSGVYVCLLNSANTHQARKMMLLR